MKKLVFACLSVTLLTVSSPVAATGLHTCESGERSAWKSKMDLEKKMIAEGWKARHIKEDGGCYEAYGTTPEGARVEAYFHPVTLEKLLVARRGQVLFRKKK